MWAHVLYFSKSVERISIKFNIGKWDYTVNYRKDINLVSYQSNITSTVNFFQKLHHTKILIYCHDTCVTTDGVWIDVWIYWPLTHTTWSYKYLFTRIPLISTLYRSLHVTSFLACSVFTSRCLVTALNNGGCSASVVMPLSAGQHSTTELSS
jgi:hypothetical protein